MSDDKQVREWRDIGDGKYQVSNDGRVMSMAVVKTGRLMKGCVNNCGYQYVKLRVDGKRKFHAVHRLVAEAFVPNAENKYAVDHIDRDKQNNHVSNLRWATRSENNINVAGRSNTGFKHISRTINHGKPGFIVTITRNRKFVVHKQFPITDRDEADVLAEVLAYRNEKCTELAIDICDK